MTHCKCGAPLPKNHNTCLVCHKRIVTEQFRAEDSEEDFNISHAGDISSPSVETESSSDGSGGDFGGGGANGDY